MADETSFCKHCKRSVPSATFTLHSTHCERFIQLCPSCQEPFPRAQMEQHTNEVHKIIECKDCKEKIESGAENDHVANHCPKRLIPCGYCEMQCTAATVQDHELVCGSRTEVCDICKNHILVRMLKTHEVLHKESSTKPTDQLKTSNKTMGIKEASANLESDVTVTKFRNVVCQNILQASAALPSIQQSEAKKKSDTFAHEMEDKEKCLLPCEFCGTLYSVDELEKHQMTCNWNKESYSRGEGYATAEQPTDASRSSFSREVGFSTTDEEYWSRYVGASPNPKEGMVDEEASVPCEICGIPFPMSCLELHEIACKFSSMSTQTEDILHGKESSTQRPARPYGVDSDYWSQYTAAAPAIEQEIAIEEISIPCEKCGTPFPISSLDIHEISCKFPKDATKNGKRSQVKEKTGSVVSTPEHDYEPAFLPCPFCNVVVSSSVLEMHKARCRSYSEQHFLRSIHATVQPAPNKTRPKNTRIENVVQRTVRNNAVVATENRLPTTPKVKQSQYAVVQLPNGHEILKKRNPSFGANEIDIGHVLGRGQPQELRDHDTPILHTAVYTNRRNSFEDSNFAFKLNGIETNKSKFNEHDHKRHPAPMNRAQKSDFLGIDQKWTVQKSMGIPATDSNVGMRVTKKPNAAFKSYAYQPDAGNKLGDGNNLSRDRRPQPRNAVAPGFYFRPENPAENVHQNQRNGENVGDIQQNARDYNNALGARPKWPQRPADKF